MSEKLFYDLTLDGKSSRANLTAASNNIYENSLIFDISRGTIWSKKHEFGNNLTYASFVNGKVYNGTNIVDAKIGNTTITTTNSLLTAINALTLSYDGDGLKLTQAGNVNSTIPVQNGTGISITRSDDNKGVKIIHKDITFSTNNTADNNYYVSDIQRNAQGHVTHVTYNQLLGSNNDWDHNKYIRRLDCNNGVIIASYITLLDTTANNVAVTGKYISKLENQAGSIKASYTALLDTTANNVAATGNYISKLENISGSIKASYTALLSGSQEATKFVKYNYLDSGTIKASYLALIANDTTSRSNYYVEKIGLDSNGQVKASYTQLVDTTANNIASSGKYISKIENSSGHIKASYVTLLNGNNDATTGKYVSKLENTSGSIKASYISLLDTTANNVAATGKYISKLEINSSGNIKASYIQLIPNDNNSVAGKYIKQIGLNSSGQIIASYTAFEPKLAYNNLNGEVGLYFDIGNNDSLSNVVGFDLAYDSAGLKLNIEGTVVDTVPFKFSYSSTNGLALNIGGVDVGDKVQFKLAQGSANNKVKLTLRNGTGNTINSGEVTINNVASASNAAFAAQADSVMIKSTSAVTYLVGIPTYDTDIYHDLSVLYQEERSIYVSSDVTELHTNQMSIVITDGGITMNGSGIASATDPSNSSFWNTNGGITSATITYWSDGDTSHTGNTYKKTGVGIDFTASGKWVGNARYATSAGTATTATSATTASSANEVKINDIAASAGSEDDFASAFAKYVKGDNTLLQPLIASANTFIYGIPLAKERTDKTISAGDKTHELFHMGVSHNITQIDNGPIYLQNKTKSNGGVLYNKAIAAKEFYGTFRGTADAAEQLTSAPSIDNPSSGTNCGKVKLTVGGITMANYQSVHADTVDGYHIVNSAPPSSPDANTIYIVT